MWCEGWGYDSVPQFGEAVYPPSYCLLRAPYPILLQQRRNVASAFCCLLLTMAARRCVSYGEPVFVKRMTAVARFSAIQSLVCTLCSAFCFPSRP